MEISKKNIKEMMNAVFSSEKDVEAFTKEQKNGEEALKPFIEICYERKIIAEKKSTKFLSFINQGQKEVGNNFSKLTFKDFIESRDKYLDSSGTVAELCEEINALTEALGLQPSLGVINKVIVTRLKTEKLNKSKRNMLRLLALFSASKGSPTINYRELLNLFAEKPQIDTHHGIQLGFSLKSQSEIVLTTEITFLKKQIKNYINEQNLKASNAFSGIDTLTYFITFFRTGDSQDMVIDFSSMNSVIELAYQTQIAWQLSPHFSPKKELIISIDCGKISDHTPFRTTTLLSADLPTNPIIRVSDKAFHDIKTKDIRILFACKSIEKELPDKSKLKIFFIKNIWTQIYFNIPNKLLQDKAFLRKNLPYLKQALSSPQEFNKAVKDRQNPITEDSGLVRFYRYQSLFLGIEIAKICLYRNFLQEALEIIRVVLIHDKFNIVCRTLRVTIYWYLGVKSLITNRSKSGNQCLEFFNLSEQEAEFISEHCRDEIDEDFYTEWGMLYSAKAICLLSMRLSSQKDTLGDEKEIFMDKAISLLQKALTLFRKPSGISIQASRSRYFILITDILISILKAYQKNADVKEERIESLIEQKSAEHFEGFGWLDYDLPLVKRQKQLAKKLSNAIEQYDNTVFFDSYRPSVLFSFAHLTWDSYPEISAEQARTTLFFLNQAIKATEKIKENDLLVYCKIKLYPSFFGADEFSGMIQQLIKIVKDKLEHHEEENKGGHIRTSPKLFFTCFKMGRDNDDFTIEDLR